MAYLRKLPNCKNWIACFLDRDGKLRNRTTKIADSGNAKERADAKRRAQQTAEVFERAARGELQREADIKETFNELLVLGGVTPVKPLSAREFFAAWIEKAEKSGKPETTLKRYRQVARDFVASLGDRAESPCEQIETADTQAYIDGLAEKGLALKTITNCLKILRIPFAEYCRLGKLPFNPAAAVEPSETARGSLEKEPFEPEQVADMLRTCDLAEHGSEWKTAIHFAYYCAMRLGDATAMTWSAIDFEKKTVTFTPQKTRRKSPRPITLPMHPALYDHLLGLSLPEAPAALITPELNRLGTNWSSRIFTAKILPLAGIDPKRTEAGTGESKGRKVSQLSFHSFRHSLASHLAAAGVSPELRMKITGHSDSKVHGSYTHTSVETLRTALEKLA
jgi:integrase